MSPLSTEARRLTGWRLRRPHVVFVQPTGAWHWPPGAARPGAVDAGAHAGPGAAPAGAHTSLAAWCRDHARSDLRLVLSGELTHTLLVNTALPIRDADAVRAYAQHQFVHYHGSAAQRWPVTAWTWGRCRGAVALHGLDLAAVVAAAAGHRVRLRSVEPYWSVALRHVSRRDAPAIEADSQAGDDAGFGAQEGQSQSERLADAESGRSALAIVEGTLVTFLSIRDGAPQAVWQRRLDAPTPGALDALIGEARRQEGLPRRLRVCGYGIAPGELAAPAAWVVGPLDGQHPDGAGLAA